MKVIVLRVVTVITVLRVLVATSACNEVDENISIRLRMNLWGVVDTFTAESLSVGMFPYRIWIDDDTVLYSHSKIYKRLEGDYSFQQISPDSLDCEGYEPCVSRAGDRLWFGSTSGTWSMNLEGKGIQKVADLGLRELHLSEDENFLCGLRPVSSSYGYINVIDLSTGQIEELDQIENVEQAYYHQTYDKISYLSQDKVFIANSDGSQIEELGTIYWHANRKLAMSASGRYAIWSSFDNWAPQALYYYDFQTGQTVNLGTSYFFAACYQTDTIIYLPTASPQAFSVARYDLQPQQMTQINSGTKGEYYSHRFSSLDIRLDDAKLLMNAMYNHKCFSDW